MFDDFFARALAAAVGLALIAPPAGCVLLWQRSAYFGETMAHSALLGAALGLLLGLPLNLAVFGTALAVALALLAARRFGRLAGDTVLGVLAPSTLAFGLMAIWLSEDRHRYDLAGLLFGDVLAVGRDGLATIWLGAACGLALLAAVWRPLVASILHPDLAAAEGAKPWRSQLVYTALVAGVVALGVQVVGMLLIVALMLIPAAAARALARTPEQMALAAAGIGVAAAVLGLHASLWLDVPAGPAIVAAALALFLLSLLRPR